MRNGLASRKSDSTQNNPYTDSCIIPKEHLDTIGISQDCTIDNHTLENRPEYTPDGCTIDLRSSYQKEDKFKDLLDKMDKRFNRKYIEKINNLKALLETRKNVLEKLKVTNHSYDSVIAEKENILRNKCDDDIITQIYTQHVNKNNKVDQYLKNKFDNFKYNDNELIKMKTILQNQRDVKDRESFWISVYKQIISLINITIPQIDSNLSNLNNLYIENIKYTN